MQSRQVDGPVPFSRTASLVLNSLTEMAAVGRQLQECLRVFGEAVLAALRLWELRRQVVAAHCEPYQREIALLGDGRIPPLSYDEEKSALIIGLLLASPEEEAHRVRPPLEYIALITRRLDIVAALLLQEGSDLPKRIRRESRGAAEEVTGDALLALHESILPRLWDRLDEVRVLTGREVLQGWLSTPYMAASIRNARLEAARTRARHAELAAAAGLARMHQERPTQTSQAEAVLLRCAVEQYLRSSTRRDVDQAVLHAIDSDVPMAQLARTLHIPSSTLKSRKQKLLAFLREHLVH